MWLPRGHLLHISYTTATPLLLLSYSSPTPLLPLSYTSATPLPHLCYTSPTPLLHLCHTSPSPLLHLSYPSATPLLPLCYTSPTYKSLIQMMKDHLQSLRQYDIRCSGMKKSLKKWWKAYDIWYIIYSICYIIYRRYNISYVPLFFGGFGGFWDPLVRNSGPFLGQKLNQRKDLFCTSLFSASVRKVSLKAGSSYWHSDFNNVIWR